MSEKDLILTTVKDLVKDFLYYERKEDQELPVGSIELAIKYGEVTINEISECFKSELIKALKNEI